MANTFAPFGFRPSRLAGSMIPNYANAQNKPILNTNTNKIYYGDPVQITTSGYIDTLAVGSSTYYAIFLGCEYLDSSAGKVFSPFWTGASTAVAGTVQAIINTDPDMLWEVQTGPSNASVGITFANIEQNVQFAYGTGNQSSGISGAYIDTGTSPANTSTLPFRVTNLMLLPNNDNTLAFNIIEVRFNNFLQNTNTGRS